MASEAQRLIGISLTKIAQSRAHRGGVSLHKNLLVATVLQKARYIFMEEAYNMVQYQNNVQTTRGTVSAAATKEEEEQQQQQLVGLTVEEAGLLAQRNSDDAASLPTTTTSLSSSSTASVGRVRECNGEKDANHHPPSYYHHQQQQASHQQSSASGELTYLDLDKTQQHQQNAILQRGESGLKRRRAITEWETEEAVQSILPKRSRSQTTMEEDDDSVFLDDDDDESPTPAMAKLSSADAAIVLSEAIAKEYEHDRLQEQQSNSMEIDRITSLVSIFSFGIGDASATAASLGGNNNASATSSSKLNRSVSTPDLCSAQAKDAEAMQRRPFLAMTV